MERNVIYKSWGIEVSDHHNRIVLYCGKISLPRKPTKGSLANFREKLLITSHNFTVSPYSVSKKKPPIPPINAINLKFQKGNKDAACVPRKVMMSGPRGEINWIIQLGNKFALYVIYVSYLWSRKLLFTERGPLKNANLDVSMVTDRAGT